MAFSDFFKSDTSGEKDFEEFFTDEEILDMGRFENIGVIKNEAIFDPDALDTFMESIHYLRAKTTWEKTEIVDLFNEIIPGFDHKETGKYLDERM